MRRLDKSLAGSALVGDTDGVRPMLHFVGFRGDEYARAVLVFGPPDFIHIGWDTWAKMEVMSNDTAVFAQGTFEDEPSAYSSPDIREDDGSNS